MNLAGRATLSTAVGLLGLAVALGWDGADSRPLASANAVAQMASATAFFDSTIVLARAAQPRGLRGDELAVALGYVERERLGIGDPFRLADEALSDPRLGTAMSPRVAWALFGRLRRGDAYVVAPALFDGGGPWAPDGRGATGVAHLALIERAIESSSDPRAGELAVRLAYAIEAAKGTLAQPTPSLATQAAALVRDRALARRDLASLLAGAVSSRMPTLAVLRMRRTDRSLDVERPVLAPLSQRLQTEAMEAVPGIVAELDTLDRVAAVPARRGRANSPLVGPHFAARLSVLGATRPPVPQIVVTLKSRARIPLRATNEETLAAAYDIDVARRGDDRDASIALLVGAVATRSRAQDVPWFPGDGGPDVGDMMEEFGVRASFGAGVPAAWRGYYTRELQTALRDMEIVFPGLSFDGVHIRFGSTSLRDSALALHDPRSRTIELPIATGGGTLAHELAHDIDWQAARRLYAAATGYSTDRAMRDRRGVLAASLRTMAESRATRSTAVSKDRPAELFARGADWFAASVLAQHGRTNAFLTAIEDGVLAGYAAGPPAALGTASTASLVSALEEMTYLPDSIRAGFEAQWSRADRLDPALLVRRALEAPVSWRTASLWLSAQDAIGIPPTSLCGADESAPARARESLLNLAIEARAQGVAMRRATFRPSSLPAGVAPSVLGVAATTPAAGERLRAGLRAALVAELGSSLADQGVVPVAPATFRSSTASCSSSAR